MKLLITGGLGFIGSNFIQKILNQHSDYEIINVDAELNGSNPKNLSQIQDHKNYEYVKGNITNKKLMEKLIENANYAKEVN